MDRPRTRFRFAIFSGVPWEPRDATDLEPIPTPSTYELSVGPQTRFCDRLSASRWSVNFVSRRIELRVASASCHESARTSSTRDQVSQAPFVGSAGGNGSFSDSCRPFSDTRDDHGITGTTGRIYHQAAGLGMTRVRNAPHWLDSLRCSRLEIVVETGQTKDPTANGKGGTFPTAPSRRREEWPAGPQGEKRRPNP